MNNSLYKDIESDWLSDTAQDDLGFAVLLSASEQINQLSSLSKTMQTFCYNLSVTGKRLTALVQVPTKDITEVELLTAQEFDCEYNDKMVITNATRKA